MGRRAAAALAAVCALAPAAGARAQVPPGPPSESPPRPSRAIGEPWDGRLVDGVQLPAAGPGFVTWDDVLHRIPSRGWRRWGTDVLVHMVERVLAAYHEAHPTALPVLVGDLSRPHGGVFDKRFGGLGHRSHQNGLDADIFYPRADGTLLAPRRPGEVDRRLSQDLVDGFLHAGAQRLFVGLQVGLTGPRRIVQRIPHHDDHLHVRIPNPGRR